MPGIVDAYPVPQQPRVIYTTASDVSRLLGMQASLDEIADALQKLDCDVEQISALPALPEELGKSAFGLHVSPGEPALRVEAPWYRLDLQVPADLAEEVARVIGYEHIDVTLMEDVLPPQRHNLVLETEEKIRDILAGSGLQETINYSLTTPEQHEKLNLPDAQGPYIELANPLSVKRRVMRRSMLVSALENLAYNSRYTSRLATFELGRVYLPERGQAPYPLEERRLSILLTGSRRPVGFWPDPAGAEEFDFFDLKGIVETLLERLGVHPGDIAWAASANTPPFGPQCAELLIRGKSQGMLGRLHAQIQQAYDLPTAPVYLAEVQVALLIKPSWEIEKMQPISSYPPVVEDLAFVVDEQTPASDVAAAIRKAGAPLLTDVALFDLYRGQPIPDSQKSLAYKVTYQSQEKSLTDDEVAAVRKKIIAQVAQSVGGTLRA